MINAQEIVLIEGGRNLEDYDLETLKKFDAVYLNGIMRGDSKSLENQCNLLSEYVNRGGGVILDTGDLPYGGEIKNIPDPFPVEETAIYEESRFLLSENRSTSLTKELDLTLMNSVQPSGISYGRRFKEDSKILVLDEDVPVVAYWELGNGRVLWTGLRLPYYSNYYGLSQDTNEKARETYEERAKFLSEMVNFVAKETSDESSARVSVEYPEPEKILVHVKYASPEESVWVKMTYFPGWKAKMDNGNTELRIFKAGPGMIMVFPNCDGSFDLTFYFEKTWDVTAGEAISSVSLLMIAGFFLYQLIIYIKGNKVTNEWDKTEHTGSGNNYVQ